MGRGGPSPWEHEALLTWQAHLHLSAAADCLAATVGAARVGALVPGLQVVDQQSAIWGLVDTVAIGPYREPIPGGERTRAVQGFWSSGPGTLRCCTQSPRGKRHREEVIKDRSRASCSLFVDKQLTLTSRRWDRVPKW